MTYERYDVGSTQPGVRHTAPNVDRVMGLAASQETTVDRLLTVVERLTAELATTQSALHDLALEVARAGIGSGGAGQAPTVGYGTGVSTLSSGTVPLSPDHASHLPPRRADHAVISELATYSPEQHRAPATDGVGRAAPQGGAAYAPHDALAGVVPADPVDAAPGAAPLDATADDGFPTEPANGDVPHAEVADPPRPRSSAPQPTPPPRPRRQSPRPPRRRRPQTPPPGPRRPRPPPRRPRRGGGIRRSPDRPPPTAGRSRPPPPPSTTPRPTPVPRARTSSRRSTTSSS